MFYYKHATYKVQRGDILELITLSDIFYTLRIFYVLKWMYSTSSLDWMSSPPPFYPNHERSDT